MAFGPGVIVGVKYATYLITFINYGVKEIDKTDPKLEEIQPLDAAALKRLHSLRQRIVALEKRANQSTTP